MPSNLRHDHSQMSTYTRDIHNANLTCISWRCTGCVKMNFPTSMLSKVIVLQPENACI